MVNRSLDPSLVWPRRILWGSLVLAMTASFGHVAAVYGGLETAGAPVVLKVFSGMTGIIAALAYEGAVFSLSWSLGHARRLKLPTRRLRVSLVFPLCIAMVANFEAIVGAGAGGQLTWAYLISRDPLFLANALAFSATLPPVASVLSGIIEGIENQEAVVPAVAPPATSTSPGTSNGHVQRRAPLERDTLPVYEPSHAFEDTIVDDEEPEFGEKPTAS